MCFQIVDRKFASTCNLFVSDFGLSCLSIPAEIWKQFQKLSGFEQNHASIVTDFLK